MNLRRIELRRNELRRIEQFEKAPEWTDPLQKDLLLDFNKNLSPPSEMIRSYQILAKGNSDNK